MDASRPQGVVLAPHAGLRAAIVPGPAQDTNVPKDEHAHGKPARMVWARLLKRLFDLGLEHCPRCGGEFRIIAANSDDLDVRLQLANLLVAQQRYREVSSNCWR
jgi:hypothetical protein